MEKQNAIQEDEIDLKELFLILYKKKFFILGVTFFVTFLALIYVFTKTPVYEVKSVVQIGTINGKIIENNKVLEKKLRLIFNVDNKKNIIKEDNAIVSNVSSVNGLSNFIQITTQAHSNELAIEKNKEIISFIKNEYKQKIDEYILKTNIKIENMEEKIKYIKTVESKEIKNKIDFLKTVELKSIKNKLSFNQQKLEEYEKNVNSISKKKLSDNTQNMLQTMQILYNQNLILNLNEEIENLNIKKQNIEDEKIPKLISQLSTNIVNKINDLKNKITIEKFKLTNGSIINSKVVGNFDIDDTPVKPKKKLIIAISFLTGFILSIFLVFFMQFINSFKKEDFVK